MNLAESVCYLLNFKGRTVAMHASTFAKNKQTFQVIERYKSTYRLSPEHLDFYINRSGTFLNRYAAATSCLERDFPGGFFKGKTVLEIGSGRGPFVLVLANESGANFVYGVEIDPEPATFSQKMLKDHGVDNAEIIAADVTSIPVASNSIDCIISYACFEHIRDLAGVIRESARVMKPNGRLYANFSPIWRHYYGSHLGKEIPFPWTHLLFSEPTVRSTLERLQRVPQQGELYQGLNKLKLSEYKRIFRKADLQITKLNQNSSSKALAMLRKIPILNEFYAGSINVVLEKPKSGP